MYTIRAYESATDNIGKTVFNLKTNKTISAGKLTLKDSDVDDFQITVNQTNFLFGNVRPLVTHIDIKQDGELIFRGRALKPKREMTTAGQHTQTFSFESILAYLIDSTQRFKEVHDTTPADFFRMLIDVHNSQVPDFKKFRVGVIDVTNSTDNVYRFVDYTTTYAAIKDKLINRLGGYLRLRVEPDGNYIDYINNLGTEHTNDNPFKIGKNLKSASLEIDPTSIITRLIPLGANIEQDVTNSSNNTTAVSTPRVDIATVNNGLDYIDIPELQTEFGIINGAQTWDDVHDPAILLTRANDWIKSQTAATETWTIGALEYGLSKFSTFKVGDSYQFINSLVADKQMIQVIQKDIDILKPFSSTFTIGQKKKSLASYQIDYRASAKKYDQLKALTNQQSNAIEKVASDFNQWQTSIQAEIDNLKSLISDGYLDGKIIDVSEFQGDIDWQAAKNDGVVLAIIRIQYGGSREDLKYKQNIAGVQAAGIRYAVYGYGLYANQAEAKEEAESLFNRANTAAGSGVKPIFYAIDLEESTMTDVKANTLAWNQRLTELGVDSEHQVAYIANQLYDQFNVDVSKFGSIWIPSYGNEPTHSYDLWQYTSKGQVAGITANTVDMNQSPSQRFKDNYLRR
ncbi:prophage protein [Weissella oryzae SG25]|uniref:Prophage protein n=1 Tax=Weissella oryzae (strain DSM 25784 / JCM 18191 / LMG 30913 / SG25) TaxID=1329250 RepID=A0A069CT65_WEIOS|nr:GH25 family lysozyme [Weissella oryzae]GAK31000.1 prophage protein [Weissella oryzae SG25]